MEQERRVKPNSRLPGHLERRKHEAIGARQSRIGMLDRLRSWVQHHRSEAVASLKRLLATPVPSFMTWAVIAIALSLPSGLFVFLQNAQQLSAGWDSVVQMSLYLKPQVTEDEGRQLSLSLEAREDVSAARYISRQQALEEFRALSGFGEALDYLDDNPLPAVIVIQPLASSEALLGTEKLLADLQALPQVDQAQLDLEWVQRLYSIMALGERAVMVLGVLLSLAVLLIIGNTIRLAIASRRDEIVVIKLVGGTDAFVRRPFLYMGVWYGMGGGILAWLVISLMLFWLSAPVGDLVSAYNSDFDLIGLGFINTLLLWLISAGLGLFGAWIAVGRHLGDIEPR